MTKVKLDRSLLVQNLIKPTLEIKRKRSIVKDIKSYLSEKYSIFEGSIQSWINNPAEELKEIDHRLLFLFAEQIYSKTGNSSILPEDYFTEAEIKSSRQFSGKMFIEEDMQFPFTFQPVIAHGHNAWTTKIHISTLVKMLNSRLLHWNPDSQREATKKILGDQIIYEPTLIMPNVIAMKNLLKKNKLETTQLTINASVGTSNSNYEVEYDEEIYSLKILDGVKCDVVDGWNRINAARMALAEKSDIDFWFELKILNMTVDRAGEYLAQISKGERISETKRKSMSKETFEDMIISELRKTEFGERISKKEGLSTSAKELVTYNSISKAIEENFDLEKPRDMYDISEYLSEFFSVLLSYFEEEFTEKYNEYKKSSLINDNNMISYGYCLLASRMWDKDIEARKVKDYIKKIDFDRKSDTWIGLGVVDNQGRLTKNPKVGIEKYFSQIEL